MNIFDILCLVFILAGFIIGFKKGFFACITKPIRIIASIALTVFISKPILDHFTRAFFVEKTGNLIYKSIGDSATATVDALPNIINFMIDLFKIPTEGITTADQMVTSLADTIGGFIAIVITYLVLFIVLMLLLKLLISILNIPFKKGVLGRVNKVLGIFLGGLIAMLIACLFVNIVELFSAEMVANPISQFFLKVVK